MMSPFSVVSLFYAAMDLDGPMVEQMDVQPFIFLQ
jgi:hypothetical protein